VAAYYWKYTKPPPIDGLGLELSRRAKFSTHANALASKAFGCGRTNFRPGLVGAVTIGVRAVKKLHATDATDVLEYPSKELIFMTTAHSKRQLSPALRRTLRAIGKHIEESGYPPTVGELAFAKLFHVAL
jgi:hypothetical protein